MGDSAAWALNYSQRAAIAAEIGASTSVTAPVFVNSAPPTASTSGGYSYRLTTAAAPSLGLGSTVSGAGDPLPFAFNLVAGALPPGLNLDRSSGTISGSPTTVGSYAATVSADNHVGSPATTSITINVVAGAPNDSIYNPIILAGALVTGTGDNTGATVEISDPSIAGFFPNFTVWWQWTAVSSNPATINTIGSSFDTLLGVYLTSPIGFGGPPLVVDNDDIVHLINPRSSVTFTPTAGTTYLIAVDGKKVGKAGSKGSIVLNISQPQTLSVSVGGAGTVATSIGAISCPGTCTETYIPNTTVLLVAIPNPGSIFIGFSGGGCGASPNCSVVMSGPVNVSANFYTVTNDSFAQGQVLNPLTTRLGGFIQPYSGYNIGASKEGGEPDHAGNSGGHSVWFAWTAPVSGSVNASLAGSSFPTLLAVYTGSAVGTLVPIGSAASPASRVVNFYATAGVQYSIAVDGVDGASGAYSLRLTQPGNDNFANRLALSGGTVSVTDSNANATVEGSEPTILGNFGSRSLWWSWTAPSTDTVTITTQGSNFNTQLGVYTGSTLASLALIASNDDAIGAQSSVTFNALAGTVYQIMVKGGFTVAFPAVPISGNVVLNILQRQPQVITFVTVGDRAYDTAPIPAIATSTSGLTVVLSTLTPSICTVTAQGISLITVGVCTIAANQPGSVSYYPASTVQQNFLISPASQSFVFGTQAPQDFSPAKAFDLIAANISTAGLPVTFLSGSPAVCTITGLTVTILSAGDCAITASQPGNANYLAAPSISQVIIINPGSQVIIFPSQAAQPYSPGGAFMIAPVAVSTSSLPVTYGTSSPAICSVSGGVVTIIATGICTVTANQPGNNNFNPAPQATQNITINTGQPGAPTIGAASGGNTQAVIAFTPSGNTGGTAIGNFTATCSANGQMTRAASGAGSPITVTQLTNDITYACSVTATNGAMLTSVASTTVNVTPTASPVPPAIISVNAISFTVFAAGSFAISSTGTPAATLSVSGAIPTGIVFTPATGMLAGTPAANQAGSYPLTITATNNSGTAMQSFTLTVQKASQTIGFSNPGAQNFSITPLTLNGSASSTLAVAYASNTPATCSIGGANGSSLSTLAPGSCTIVASQAGNADYSAAASIMQTFLIGTATQVVTFPAQTIAAHSYANGTSFVISPLAIASSGLPVSYRSLTLNVCSVSGASVTMVAAGICTIAANQGGNAAVTPAPTVARNVIINAVAPGAPAITSAVPGNAQAVISFSAPADSGGSAIMLYTANCGAFSASSASVAPITVTGLSTTTTYNCTVSAANSAGQGAASTGVQVTPLSGNGATIWATTCALSGCHGAGALPAPPRFNAAGSSTTVLDFVFANQAVMKLLPSVTGLTPTERKELAAYLLNQSPGVNVSTPFNTAASVDVLPNLVLNSPTATFQSVEVVTAPVNGTLSAGGFTGTTITYTPNNGFIGTDSFTYRGVNTSGTPFVGDAREVFIIVQTPGPVITSALTASGTVGLPFVYQITATNLPTLYTATGLPGTLSLNADSGVISGTPATAAILNLSIGTSNATGSDSKTLVITISQAPQFISFPAQVVQTRPFSAGNSFPINPPASGGTSGNPIAYGSTTPGVCTVSSSAVTIVAAGICTLTADQAGNADYAAAPTATQGVTITPVVPGAPTGIGATPGTRSAVVSFTGPAFNGGSPVTFYTVLCNNGALPTNGAASPITVTDLTIGQTYACAVTASNSAGAGAASTSVMVTPVAITFTGLVQSRKLHAGQGTFSIDINPTTAIDGAIDVEPRVIGSGHQIAFGFSSPPSSVNGLSITDVNNQPVIGASATPSFIGNELIITLTGIPDNNRVKILAIGVNGAVDVSAAIGFLVGDVNGTRSVNSSDINGVKARSGQPTTAANFKFDVNASGSVNSSDISTVKARSGLTMPPS